MKMAYVSAEMEVILFENEDVIATSDATSAGLINGGVGSGDSGRFEDLFPGLA